MSQRLVAAFIAVPAVIALLCYAFLKPLPYATYSPGGTINVLGTDPSRSNAEIIQVDGAKTYDDDGQLRMTTVRVSPVADEGETGGEGLVTLLSTWFNSDNAVYPYDVIHPEDQTPESNRKQGQVQMAGSQDAAVDVALTEMGIEVPQVLQITALTPGLPAEKVLKVGDVILTVNGAKADNAQKLVALISDSPADKPLTIGVSRDGKTLKREVTPVRDKPQDPSRIGITPEVSEYQFPFEVQININPAIGGPSAGLIFSLAVYDTLTPGTLTGGHEIAGTGELFPNGQVGPIGGIQQKIAGSRNDGADLFIVPIDNCADALKADNGDMRLMMAETMHDVRVALEAYAADENADLPSCKDAPAILAGAAR